MNLPGVKFLRLWIVALAIAFSGMMYAAFTVAKSQAPAPFERLK